MNMKTNEPENEPEYPEGLMEACESWNQKLDEEMGPYRWDVGDVVDRMLAANPELDRALLEQAAAVQAQVHEQVNANAEIRALRLRHWGLRNWIDEALERKDPVAMKRYGHLLVEDKERAAMDAELTAKHANQALIEKYREELRHALDFIGPFSHTASRSEVSLLEFRNTVILEYDQRLLRDHLFDLDMFVSPASRDRELEKCYRGPDHLQEWLSLSAALYTEMRVHYRDYGGRVGVSYTYAAAMAETLMLLHELRNARGQTD
jgi:hypothetical protein